MPEPSQAATPGAALEHALARELSSLEALHRCLVEEREALLGRDPVAVEAAAACKGELLATLASLQDTRRALAPGEDLEAAIEARDCREGNRAKRQALIELGDSCEALNRDNGQLIARLQAHTRAALAILRNSDVGPRLYSIDGSREGDSDRQSLGKA